MKRIISIIICAVLIISAGFMFYKQYNKHEQDKAAEAFKSKIIKLKTVKYNSGFDDLLPLEPILKDKKIVAMGEATHGTKEFFQMKHRMFQFLVEKMGYNIFGIEASMPDCMKVNDYILYGKGNLKQVVDGMGYWTWDTNEVSDMVEWMKKYNELHAKKIKFYGFDMQYPCTASKNVIWYLKKVDAQYESSVDSIISEFNDMTLCYKVNKKLPYDKIKEIMDHFEKYNNDYIKRSSKEQYELYKENLNIICQFCDLNYDKNNFNRESKRDKYMAENIKWILDNEEQDSKMMVWAHNIHVSKSTDRMGSSSSDYQEGNVKRMGSNLHDIYGNKLYVIGFEFNKGSFRANAAGKNGQMVNKECTIKAPGPECVSYIFSKVNPLFFIDFKTCENDEHIKKILSGIQNCHYIPAGFSGEKNACSPQILDDMYDGLIFIDTTSSSEPLWLNK